ncbi:MAG: HAMP domain-containing histidine kinase [Colwellia sp.]|nr:HAMP domain-containing histidine kinase [Colwellia sp.]
MNSIKFQRLPIYYQAWLFGGIFCFALLISVIALLSKVSDTTEDHSLLAVYTETCRDIYQLSGLKALEKSVNRARFTNTKVMLFDNTGRLLYSNDTSWHLPADINWQLDKGASPSLRYLSEPSKSIMEPETKVKYLVSNIDDNKRLVVAQDITYVNNDLVSFPWQIWLFILTFFIAGIGGIFVGYFVKKRLTQINLSCKHIIEQGDLSARIPCDNSNKDFDLLSSNINIMLTHIQQLMSDVKQVSDNIAHDLRTHLTRLRNKLETVELQSLRPEQITNIHVELKQELDDIINIFNALLRIANLEYGEQRKHFSSIDINLLLVDLVEFYQPLAIEKHQQLSVHARSYAFLCDVDLLFQAMANCIENAIKYTPANGNIIISTATSAEYLTITIADNGIGIPKDDREKVCQRFYRVEQSRHTTGNGLGLSLVNAIVQIHHGKIRITDNCPGTKIQLILPIISHSTDD